MVESAKITKSEFLDLVNKLSKEMAEFNIYVSAEKIMEMVQAEEVSIQELEENGAVPILEYLGAGVSTEEEDFEYIDWEV